MKHSCFTRLARAIEDAGAQAEGIAEIWLFGSALTASEPRDLDLLVVYRSEVTPPVRAGELRDAVRAALANACNLPVDVVLLNETEAEETAFAETERAVVMFRRAG